ncbi:putative GTP-binding protein EngB [Arenimonas maotaiensis]|uniref:Probable GTP-binding protein EngB n=1 Tax=Arenimonas maotaiensis TaxID=1446479 RepID=A0A917FKD8_9GAMM|nr:ribosome biogenesis GTP-binding protein YihA/YsxC [Arenimonas maotaiensis]MCC6757925.1 YihA family ribosome biogenesis GTP-binding protein [Arenimonas sp.]GGF89040.1 putative GTP-binding protein EngB [Arenimonas maotaiensis]
MANPLAQAEFVLSANALAQLPKDGAAEVAFAGRSNAGKSTALNALCQHGGLARTSKTPGRTQHLVYFRVGEGRYLVDLPGYGYAKVPIAVRDHWQAFIARYFQVREPLAGLVLVMDIRHPLREYDQLMLDVAFKRHLPVHCLLTKADKLGRGEQTRTLMQVKKELAGRASAQLFSGSAKIGLDEARAVVLGWLQAGPHLKAESHG